MSRQKNQTARKTKKQTAKPVKKVSRWGKERKKHAKKQETTTVVAEEAEADVGEALETTVNNSFFYTQDKFFASLDQDEILKTLVSKYPNFSTNNDDGTIKKALVQMLNDTVFMQKTLKYYNLTIYDFFKILYKSYASLFRGSFLKKIKNELEGQPYAKTTRLLSNY